MALLRALLLAMLAAAAAAFTGGGEAGRCSLRGLDSACQSLDWAKRGGLVGQLQLCKSPCVAFLKKNAAACAKSRLAATMLKSMAPVLRDCGDACGTSAMMKQCAAYAKLAVHVICASPCGKARSPPVLCGDTQSALTPLCSAPLRNLACKAGLREE